MIRALTVVLIVMPWCVIVYAGLYEWWVTSGERVEAHRVAAAERWARLEAEADYVEWSGGDLETVWAQERARAARVMGDDIVRRVR